MMLTVASSDLEAAVHLIETLTEGQFYPGSPLARFCDEWHSAEDVGKSLRRLGDVLGMDAGWDVESAEQLRDG